jgi:transposase
MCFRCGVVRELVLVSPLGPELELRQYTCPKCGKVLRLKIRNDKAASS